MAALPVLLHVLDHESVHATDVVEHFGIDKGAVSRHVVHLESLGLLARTCDPEDRRAQTLVAGRLTDWSSDDLVGLADLLARYNSSLEAPPQD